MTVICCYFKYVGTKLQYVSSTNKHYIITIARKIEYVLASDDFKYLRGLLVFS